MNAKLREVLEQNREYYIEQLKNIIAIDTHDIGHGIGGGLEAEGQDYMIRLFEEMGASEIIKDDMEEAVIQECFDKYHEGNLGHNQENRYNVYATFKGSKGGKSLLFNSHIDVMPADEVDEWTTPPFQPDIRDGKMYGRGTADMKAGLMASAMAVKLIQDAGMEIPGDVIITSVCDEEGGGNGSMQAVMRGLKADGVINCENSEGKALLAHMGWVFFKVEFEGKACHSGGKKNGVSAIDKAIKVIQALNEMEHSWLLEYKHPLLPPPNLNVGVIEGGTAGSTVPDYCSFSTCVHYIPNMMSHDQVVREFTECVERTAKGDAWMAEHMPKITIYQAGNGFEQEGDHAFVKALCNAFETSTGKKLITDGCMCGNDARLWKNIAESPTVIYGPGRLAQCHGIDEWVSIDEYLEVILVYAQLILDWGTN